jgi:hypothetical protein
VPHAALHTALLHAALHLVGHELRRLHGICSSRPLKEALKRRLGQCTKPWHGWCYWLGRFNDDGEPAKGGWSRWSRW